MDIVDLIHSYNVDEEERVGSKNYIPLDQRTILMEHALTAADEIDRLRNLVRIMTELLVVQ